MSKNSTPIRPMSGVSDHYRSELHTQPKKLPASAQKPPPDPNPPILTEETTMRIKKPELITYSSKLIESKILKLPCFHHNNKVLDQICVKENCEFGDHRLFCSKCAVSDENHIKSHRAHICEIQGFLTEKICEIQGKPLEKSMEESLSRLKSLQTHLKHCNETLQTQIDKDFKDLIQNMVSYTEEIAKDMKSRLLNFFNEISKVLDEKNNEIVKLGLQMSTEQAYVFNDLGRFLEVIDCGKESQVNEFFRNFMRQTHKYTAEEEFMLFKLKFDALEKKVNEASFYNRREFERFRERILENLHSSHFKENIFLQIPEIQNLPQSQKINEIKGENNQNNNVNSFEFNAKNTINSVEMSLKATLNTESFQGINGVLVDNEKNLLFTCSNDRVIKLWLFNEKPVFILLDSVTTPGLALSMRFFPEKNLLFASSGIDIHCYGTELQAKDKIMVLMNCLKGHKKQVKALEIFDDDGILISLSQDNTIKKWDINTGNCLETLNLTQEYRVTAKGFDGILCLGSKSGFLNVLNIKTLANQEKPLEKQIFKESITAISALGREKIAIGSKRGRIKIVNMANLEKICDIKDINKGSIIYGILPFFCNDEYKILMVLSWGGEISVWDIKNKRKTASCQHFLKMTAEKHHNFQGTALYSTGQWVITSGNDDKNLDIFEFSVR